MMKICKHCKHEFDVGNNARWMINHTRWCEANPKRAAYNKANSSSSNAIKAMNAKRKETGITNQFSKAKILGNTIPESKLKGKPGLFLGKQHTEEAKQKQREGALSSNHRRLRRKMIEYKGVMLDSTWELALAIRLDDLNIKWIRPDPVKWIDENNITHNYFPDFYLPDYDIYLDPKNPIAYIKQYDKIQILKEQLTNLIILCNIVDIKNYAPVPVWASIP